MTTEATQVTAEQDRRGEQKTGSLPLAGSLRALYGISLLIAALTTAAALAGVLYPQQFYPTRELYDAAYANDLVTLLLGLPALLLTMWLAHRRWLIGLLLWPGALFYGFYNYTAYLFSMPFALLFPLYLAIVTLSAYTTIALVATIDGQDVKKQLQGHVRERLCGGALALMGLLFLLLATSMLVSNAGERGGLPAADLAVFVADFVVTPAWIIGGALLWLRRSAGYKAGGALLFSALLLFVGVIAIVILRSALNPDQPWATADIFTLSLMGLIAIVPFLFFARGALKPGQEQSS
jgi:hypothetical protein